MRHIGSIKRNGHVLSQSFLIHNCVRRKLLK